MRQVSKEKLLVQGGRRNSLVCRPTFRQERPRWSQGPENGCDSSRHREVLVQVINSR
jgi:hypothetical protein